MLKITTEKNDKTLTYKLDGELDLVSSKDLSEAITIDECDEMIIDCSKLAYLTSAGIRVLMATDRDMSIKGGSLTILNINEAVKEVFELTGVDKVLTIG
ncbi:MAG: STAS domain-containing protein [Clostridiales bacterium]|nr:STAS domain-containing protein [Candidatus Crickella equi]